MEEEIIKYKDWKTGEEREYNPRHSSWIISKINLIYPFDNTHILERSYNIYHNEHFCLNCGAYYSRTRDQEEINQQAKDSI